MNALSEHVRVLRQILEHPTRGVVGVVDEMLEFCRQRGLQLDWQSDRCRVRSVGGDWEELLDAPLRKSVFRAIIARVAALCNEHTPNSVSPYGGQGMLSVGPNPAQVFRVVFVNTPAEQKLALMTKIDAAAVAPSQSEAHAGQA
ncbi:MAG: hypothetical protein L0Y72_13400 [Gemmataceae bacterium]|nr:hypothetical protein [Gemmataceae bacterium]